MLTHCWGARLPSQMKLPCMPWLSDRLYYIGIYATFALATSRQEPKQEEHSDWLRETMNQIANTVFRQEVAAWQSTAMMVGTEGMEGGGGQGGGNGADKLGGGGRGNLEELPLCAPHYLLLGVGSGSGEGTPGLA